MVGIKEIQRAYDLSGISEAYQGKVEVTDLRDKLGTKGHLLLVRGDRAYTEKLGSGTDRANPKFWIYENLISSQRVQRESRSNPDHKFFDGVGPSSLEALSFHADRLGKEAVVVMAREIYDGVDPADYPNVEIIRAEGPAEQGYVDKQAEVLATRKDLIPLHQALYGARAMTPIGNRVARTLEEMSIVPDEAHFVLASGSNLYGIGSKLRDNFSNCEVVLAEPEDKRTIDRDLDLGNKVAVKTFAGRELGSYDLDDWDGEFDKDLMPLHIKHPNRYLLLNWRSTGDLGIDRVVGVRKEEVERTKELLEELGSDYKLTGTSLLALTPALKSANEGKNVVVMAYGKNRSAKSERIKEEIAPVIPWIFRGETLPQKVAEAGLVAGLTAAGIYYMLNVDPNAPPISFV